MASSSTTRRVGTLANHVAATATDVATGVSVTVEPDTFRSADPPLTAADLAALPGYTAEEVAERNSRTKLLVVIRGLVYDLTKFASVHPGGLRALQKYGGGDATTVFEEVHTRATLRAYGATLVVGRLVDQDAAVQSAAAVLAPPSTIGLKSGSGPLGSPFPAEQFEEPAGVGALNAVEAFKFQV